MHNKNLFFTLLNIVTRKSKITPTVFHYSDHLGGTSWITDGDGHPVQHLQYLPFGEPFVD